MFEVTIQWLAQNILSTDVTMLRTALADAPIDVLQHLADDNWGTNNVAVITKVAREIMAERILLENSSNIIAGKITNE